MAWRNIVGIDEDSAPDRISTSGNVFGFVLGLWHIRSYESVPADSRHIGNGDLTIPPRICVYVYAHIYIHIYSTRVNINACTYLYVHVLYRRCISRARFPLAPLNGCAPCPVQCARPEQTISY